MSLYPQDQEINMFGEILKYPNMGEDGKFTNGSFSDPKIKPSFIPAETINLILDNLENVMKEANIETNTENTNQLKDAVKKIINNSQNNLEAKINKEITDRTQADTTLQNNINTEKARITKEITDRTNADKNLQNQINSIMSLIPKDIKTNVEFDTGKTLDGKRMYGMYVKKSFSVESSGKTYNPRGGVTIANNVTELIYSEIKCYYDQILSNVINNRSIDNYIVRDPDTFKIPIHIGLETNVDRLTKKLGVSIVIQHLTQAATIVPAGKINFNVIGFVFYTK